MSTWKCSEPIDGVLHVTIDREGQSVNSLSRSVMEELAELVSDIRGNSTLRGVVFRSGKRGSFIVGADVNELKQLEGGDAAKTLSQYGQGVFSDLESLNIPTVALISGSCLGGGLEFAMACTYRIADDHSKTLLGLPEVKLGLIPAWGGTVRLPRLIGLSTALPMILGGSMVNSFQARSRGLIHDVVATEALDYVGDEVLTRLQDSPGKPVFKNRKVPLSKKMIDSKLGQRLALRTAEKQLRKKTHGHYPAPHLAIKVLETGMLEDRAAGFEAESNAVVELADTAVTTELMRLFFLKEDAKNPPADLKIPVNAKSIGTAAVLGAGNMGAGVAYIMAQKDISVRLKDIAPEYVSKGVAHISKLLNTQVKRRRMTRLRAEQITDRISPTTDYRGLKNADIVVEAVVEELDIKRKVFSDLAAATSSRTVLATNTSSLLVSEIAENVPHPERVVGLHFFNPAEQMPLVEVIRTDRTSPEALATALALTERLGKTKVVVRDCAGFLVNRLLAPYMNEVGYLLAEVSDPMQLEQAALDFGFPMGPIALTDLVGVDVAAHVAQNMHNAYGPRMEPAPLWSKLRELRAAGNLKGGRLLQKRRFRQRLHPEIKRTLGKLSAKKNQGPDVNNERIIQRLVYPVINEAARCIAEGIVDEPEHVDLAMVFGTGFAPFRGGPLRYADSIGIEKIVDTLERWAPEHPRLAPSEALRRYVADKRSFLKPLSEQMNAA